MILAEEFLLLAKIVDEVESTSAVVAVVGAVGN